ncbi:MAG: DUF6282 family protein [Actinomycetota bacterium]|nr:DUF6282 family protein [Actinomycetota bacterium]
MTFVWDLHVHASPSTSPRWGSDLALIEAAHRDGLRGFVLKSHHESTASRAIIANEFAARIGVAVQVIGSVVLNPWVSLIELQRAIDLGARVVWWPTRSADGRNSKLTLPELHSVALERVAAAGGIVATGHLSLDAARVLVSDAGRRNIPVIVTHPFNPNVGVGAQGARQLATEGGVIEIDAYSLHVHPEAVPDIVAEIAHLQAEGTRLIMSSDGGQAATGNPFDFRRRAFEGLCRAGLTEADAFTDAASSLIEGVGIDG